MKTVYVMAVFYVFLSLSTGCSPSNMGAAHPDLGIPDSGLPDQGQAASLALSEVSPALGPTTGGIPIKLEGQGFAPDATVYINGHMATPLLVPSSTRLIAQLPPSPGVIGDVQVTVINPDGKSVSRGNLFAYYGSQLTFQGPGTATGSTALWDLAVGDLDGDNRPDVIVANRDSLDISVMIGDGAGRFSKATKYAVPLYAKRLTLGDFDGDNKLDLVVGYSMGSAIGFLRGDGTGALSAPISSSAGGTPSSIVTGDFNGDTKLDLAITTGSNTVSILLGDGAGRFAAPADFTVGTMAGAVVARDLNGDGKLDLAVANIGSNDVSILLGDGAGGFTPAPSVPVGIPPLFLAGGDFNGDNRSDLSVVGTGALAKARVLIGDGAGNFVATPLLDVGAQVVSASVADLNGDQKLDLAMVALSPSMVTSVSAAFGDGSGGFATPMDITTLRPTAGSSPMVAAADLNRDNKTDLVIAQVKGNGLVTVLLGEGSNKFANPFILAGSDPTSNPNSVLAEDFNNDDRVDLVATSNGVPGINVWLGGGSGKFSRVTNSSDFLGAGSAGLLATGDFNGDTKRDLVVVSSSLSVLCAGDGSGHFPACVPLPVIYHAFGVAAGDINGDGKPDLAFLGPDGVAVLLGDGRGGFASPVDFAFFGGSSMVAGDFNGDSKLDLAIATSTNSLLILLGNAVGSFSRAPSIMLSGPGPLAVGDFNLDGKLDVAVISSSNSRIGVLPGDGTGSFGSPILFPMSASYVGLAVGDFNADKRLDLAVAVGTRNVSILLGQGTGGFSTGVTVDALGFPYSIATADFNGDQKLDLLVANTNDNGLVALMNQLR